MVWQNTLRGRHLKRVQVETNLVIEQLQEYFCVSWIYFLRNLKMRNYEMITFRKEYTFRWHDIEMSTSQKVFPDDTE